MAISNVQLGTGETTILSPGAFATYAILSLIFCNTDLTASHTITIYAYPSGGSASDSTTIIKSLVIQPGDTFVWSGNEKIIITTSDKISGLADSASKVTVTSNYYSL